MFSPITLCYFFNAASPILGSSICLVIYVSIDEERYLIPFRSIDLSFSLRLLFTVKKEIYPTGTTFL